MPMRQIQDMWEVVCINGCIDPNQPATRTYQGKVVLPGIYSTMLPVADVGALMAFGPTPLPLPPIVVKGDPTKATPPQMRNAEKLLPIRAFVCTMCGYVEFYRVRVVHDEPESVGSKDG